MRNNRINILLAFASIYIIWGSTYFALKFGIKTIPPFLLSSMRFLLSGGLLLIYCLLKRKTFPNSKAVLYNSICGILMLGGGAVSVAWAEQYVPSSIAAIIVTFLPFWFILLDKKQWSYYFNNKIILFGLVFGFTGVLLLTNFAGTNTAGLNKPGNATIGMIVILFGGIAWTTGSLISKYKTSKDTLLVNGSIQMLATAVVCFILSLLSGEVKTFSFQQVSLQSFEALIYLASMGSIVAYLSYIYLLSVRPAVQVSTYVYINPVIAVLLGVLFDNETINLVEIISLFIILCGVLFVNLPKYVAIKKMQ